MESETIDPVVVVDGDCSDPVVLWQEVVIPLSHYTKLYKCIVTPCSIVEYHVEHHATSISLFLTIVF